MKDWLRTIFLFLGILAFVCMIGYYVVKTQQAFSESKMQDYLMGQNRKMNDLLIEKARQDPSVNQPVKTVRKKN